MGCGGSKPGQGTAGGTAGATENYAKFHSVFAPLSVPSNKAQRNEAWKLADPNGNGVCSLAEIDGWIQKTLLNTLPSQGDEIWKCFRPSYIRAFNDAKDVAAQKDIKGTNTDDFVSKKEFRLCCAYLCIYAKMWDAFALIDGGGAGVTALDDKKLSKDEVVAGLDKIKGYGFVVFNSGAPEDHFTKMDADGKGAVMLIEFCRYIEDAESKAKTDIGKLLLVGDED
jgi:hypothetical protein